MNGNNSFKFLFLAVSTFNSHIKSVLAQPYRFSVKIFILKVFKKNRIQKPKCLLRVLMCMSKASH